MTAAASPKTADELAKSMRGCASWSYWIAALTAVNAGLAVSGSDTSFLAGTLVAQIAMFAGKQSGSTGLQIFALGFNVLVIGFFVAMGFFARKGHRWAFMTAMVAYALDTLLLLIDPSAIAIGIHAWALISLGIGFKQAKMWRLAVEAEAAAVAARPPPLPMPTLSPEPPQIVTLPLPESAVTPVAPAAIPASRDGQT